MTTNNFRNIPLGVLLLAAFYMFGALVLLISIFINPVGVSKAIALAHALSPTMGTEVLLAVAALALVLAYGLISLSRWGFILTLAYSLYIGVVSLVMGGLSFAWIGQPEMQIYFGNLLWSALATIYLLTVRRRFLSAS